MKWKVTYKTIDDKLGGILNEIDRTYDPWIERIFTIDVPDKMMLFDIINILEKWYYKLKIIKMEEIFPKIKSKRKMWRSKKYRIDKDTKYTIDWPTKFYYDA